MFCTCGHHKDVHFMSEGQCYFGRDKEGVLISLQGCSCRDFKDINTTKMGDSEEWRESFSNFIKSRPKIHTVYIDLDVVTDKAILEWAVAEIGVAYGEEVEIIYFRSSDAKR